MYFIFGVFFLALGIVGVVLPLIPTTGPLLLAAFFLARSSDRLHSWLMHHPRFGTLLSDFQAGRGIPMRVKMVAIVAMSLAFSLSIWRFDVLWVRAAMALIGVLAIAYVARLPIVDRQAG
ncbi:YbaN family protein [bacterium]|nr:YbaN family protein [bacterium]